MCHFISENIKSLDNYTLQLQVLLNESDERVFWKRIIVSQTQVLNTIC